MQHTTPWIRESGQFSLKLVIRYVPLNRADAKCPLDASPTYVMAAPPGGGTGACTRFAALVALG
jgi:hypothetical protein